VSGVRLAAASSEQRGESAIGCGGFDHQALSKLTAVVSEVGVAMRVARSALRRAAWNFFSGDQNRGVLFGAEFGMLGKLWFRTSIEGTIVGWH
jgi:hypothetical protein